MEKITKAVAQEVDIPLTVKIRSGWSPDSIVAKDAAQLLENSGAQAITIHPRTRNMLFSGKSNWEIIKNVKESVNIPVVGNGDIDSPEKAKQMMDETGCDFIMIGRGAFGNPWIFKEINFYLENGYKLSHPDYSERIDYCIEHFKHTVRNKGEFLGVRQMRKHIGWYTVGLPFSSEFRNEINRIDSGEEVIEKLLSFKLKINRYEQQ